MSVSSPPAPPPKKKSLINCKNTNIYYILYLRSKTYQLDDFLGMWAEKLRGSGEDEIEHTMMTVKLSKDIDKYKVRICSCLTLSCTIYLRDELGQLDMVIKN